MKSIKVYRQILTIISFLFFTTWQTIQINGCEWGYPEYCGQSLQVLMPTILFLGFLTVTFIFYKVLDPLTEHWKTKELKRLNFNLAPVILLIVTGHLYTQGQPIIKGHENLILTSTTLILLSVFTVLTLKCRQIIMSS